MLTLGLYALVWFYAVNRELARLTLRPWPVERRLRDLGVCLAASGVLGTTWLFTGDETFLALAAIASIASVVFLVIVEFRTCESVERANRRRGRPAAGAVPLFLVLLVLPIVGIPWVQSQINRAARR